MEVRIALSLILSVLSLSFACVMLAGSSDDCGILSNVPWATVEVPWATVESSSQDVRLHIGTKGLCISGGHEEGEYFKFTDELFSSCADAGKLSTDCTIVVAALTFLITVISMVRLKKPSGSCVKATALLLAIMAIVFDIIAIGHFDDMCVSDVDDLYTELISDTSSDPNVGIILGAVMVFLLTFVTILHAMAS